MGLFQCGSYVGGYFIYRIDADTAEMAVALTARLLSRIHHHLHGIDSDLPPWMESLRSLKQNSKT
jgi:hypothetical protein